MRETARPHIGIDGLSCGRRFRLDVRRCEDVLSALFRDLTIFRSRLPRPRADMVNTDIGKRDFTFYGTALACFLSTELASGVLERMGMEKHEKRRLLSFTST